MEAGSKRAAAGSGQPATSGEHAAELNRRG
jgi:hypothetical protein